MISRGAGLLAKGITTLSDPTSGFMAIRKRILEGVKLDPLGWKIVLEAIVKTDPRFLEVPIVFADRKEGESKLGFRAQLDYLRHIWRLYCYRFPGIPQFFKFCIVGISGLLVDTAVLVALVSLFSFDPRFAAVFAFVAAVSWNYVFNRGWAFEFGRKTKILNSYIAFLSICILGLSIRIIVMHVLIEYAGMGESPWYILSSLLGIAVATIFNFLGSKYIVFSKFFSRE
jgi:dolichol-phosphate mannosyltransferase